MARDAGRSLLSTRNLVLQGLHAPGRHTPKALCKTDPSSQPSISLTNTSTSPARLSVCEIAELGTKALACVEIFSYIPGCIKCEGGASRMHVTATGILNFRPAILLMRALAQAYLFVSIRRAIDITSWSERVRSKSARRIDPSCAPILLNSAPEFPLLRLRERCTPLAGRGRL